MTCVLAANGDFSKVRSSEDQGLSDPITTLEHPKALHKNCANTDHVFACRDCGLEWEDCTRLPCRGMRTLAAYAYQGREGSQQARALQRPIISRCGRVAKMRSDVCVTPVKRVQSRCGGSY